MTRLAALAAAVLSVLALLPGPTAAGRAKRGFPAIEVISARADLIAGGQALVAIRLPPGVRRSKVQVWLGRRRVTRRFARRSDGRFEGLLTGLRNGRNTLRAVLPTGTRRRSCS